MQEKQLSHVLVTVFHVHRRYFRFRRKRNKQEQKCGFFCCRAGSYHPKWRKMKNWSWWGQRLRLRRWRRTRDALWRSRGNDYSHWRKTLSADTSNLRSRNCKRQFWVDQNFAHSKNTFSTTQCRQFWKENLMSCTIFQGEIKPGKHEDISQWHEHSPGHTSAK